MDVWFELLKRLGKKLEINEYWNRYIGLDEANQFKPEEDVSWDQVGDRALKYYFGPDQGIEWFKEHGHLIWPKKVEEAYWRCFTDARVPIYLEFLIDLKEKIEKIAEGIGIKVNWDQYTPLISWFPSTPHLIENPEYDLYCFGYRDILHTGTCTMQQPWLDEASKMNPYTYNITMNVDTAKRKGLQDHDLIEIESSHGHKVRGTLKLSKGQHPETVALVSAGHWAKGQPVAKGKGTPFTFLLEQKFEKCDALTLNVETCVKAKVKKVGRAQHD